MSPGANKIRRSEEVRDDSFFENNTEQHQQQGKPPSLKLNTNLFRIAILTHVFIKYNFLLSTR